MQTEETNITSISETVRTPKDAAKYYNRTGGAICLHFAIMQVVQLIAMLIMAIVMAVNGKSSEVLKSLSSPSTLLYLIAISYVTANLTGSLIALALNGKTKNSFRQMFARSGFTASLTLLCIPAVMCIQSVSIVLQEIFTAITGSSGMENMQMPELIPGNMLNNIVYVFYVGFAGPITEELLFRGAVMKGFNFAGKKFAVVFSAFWFAIFHGNIMQGIIAFLLGVFFGYINIKAGSLLPSVLFHITNNLTAILLETVTSSMSEEVSGIFYIIYLAATIILGGICLFIVLSKLKKQPSKENAFFEPEYTPDDASKKKYGLRAALRSPWLWIAFTIYAILIVSNIIISSVELPM